MQVDLINSKTDREIIKETRRNTKTKPMNERRWKSTSDVNQMASWQRNHPKKLPFIDIPAAASVCGVGVRPFPPTDRRRVTEFFRRRFFFHRSTWNLTNFDIKIILKRSRALTDQSDGAGIHFTRQTCRLVSKNRKSGVQSKFALLRTNRNESAGFSAVGGERGADCATSAASW